jgi:hypothetical protein
MSNFRGEVQSKLERGMINQRVTNRDLALASMNPLVEALNSTDTQMKFSKPFYPSVFNPKGKIDIELSHDVAENLEGIDFYNWAQIASKDAFNMGRGVSELSYGKDSASGYIKYGAMERRPTDTFIKPKNDKIKSTALRFKGFYYKDGVLNFDQTLYEGGNAGKIISLDPKQVFSLAPLGARFPDESTLEFLISFLDLAQYSYNLIYVVLSKQIDPTDVIETEDLPGNAEISQKIIEGVNSFENMRIPQGLKLEHPVYKDRLDILKFYNAAIREMYKIVFPVAALSDGGENGSALLDNTNSASKSAVFFSYVQSGRIKFCREVNKVGNNWLDFNGFLKQGYRFEMIPAPIEPKDTTIEKTIMSAARKSGDISSREYRNWINASVAGVRLEDDFENENDLGPKVQPKVDPSINKTFDKIKDGENPVQAMADLVPKYN